MTILASTLVTIVNERIGGPVATANGGTLTNVNRACGMFFTMHSWRNALVAQALLDLTASVGTVSLPSNFASLLGISRTDGGFIDRTTLPLLMQMRHASQGTLNEPTLVAVDGLNRLQVYPIPSGDSEDAIAITYSTRFVPLDASDEVGVADFAEPFLIECCVAYCAGVESNTVAERWQALTQSMMYEDVKRMDGAGSPVVDPGGMPVPLGSTDAYWRYGGIT